MAQFTYDPAAKSLGSASDVTNVTGGATATATIETSDLDGLQVLKLVGSSSDGRHLLRFTGAPTGETMEVYMRWRKRSSRGDDGYYVTARDQTTNVSGSGRSFYSAAVQHELGSTITEYSSGAITDLDSEVDFQILQNQIIHSLINTTGSTINASFWVDGWDEPASPTHTATDSTITGTGSAGVYFFREDSIIEILWFSVGTDGDSAPRDPSSVGATDFGDSPFTFTRINPGVPVLTTAGYTGDSIHSLRPYDMSHYPAWGAQYLWLYGTDHDSGTTGIKFGKGDNLDLSDFVDLGTKLVPQGTRDQLETPFYLYNPDDANGRPHYFYAHSVAGTDQNTELFTTADPLNGPFTWEGVVLNTGVTIPLDGRSTEHTGYARVIRRGAGDFVAWSLLIGGGTLGRWGYWTSADGKSWTLEQAVDTRSVVSTADRIRKTETQGYEFTHEGTRYFIATDSPPDQTGSTSTDRRITLLRMADDVTYDRAWEQIDFATPVGDETTDLRYVSGYHDTESDTVYLYYSCSGGNVFMASASLEEVVASTTRQAVSTTRQAVSTPRQSVSVTRQSLSSPRDSV